MTDELRGRTFATLYAVVRLCLLLSLTISPLFADLYEWLFSLAAGEPRITLGGFSYGFPGVRLALWGGALLTIASGLYAAPRAAARCGPSRACPAIPRTGIRRRTSSRSPVEDPTPRPTRHRSRCPTSRGRATGRRGRRVTGRFVVLEGGDGSGKSTQMPRLADWLRGRGIEVVVTREPGGTPLGQTLRALVLEGEDSIDPRTEALLMAADRAQHVAEVIRPALASGAWVLSDRHVPSSLVYQGVVRELGVEAIEEVNAWATGGLVPDLVIVLDVSEDVAATRRPGTPDRLEREGDALPRRGARRVPGAGATRVGA